MFGKRLFSGSCCHSGIQGGLWSPGSVWFPHHIWPVFSEESFGDGSISGTGLLYLNFFRQLWGRSKFLPKSFGRFVFISKLSSCQRDFLGVATFAVLHVRNVDDTSEIPLKAPQGAVFLLRSRVSVFPVFCSFQIALNHTRVMWFCVNLCKHSPNASFFLIMSFICIIFFHNTVWSHKINLSSVASDLKILV